MSALFAGAETALFLVAREKNYLQKEKNERGALSKVILLLQRPSRLLMTILLGNLFVNLSFFAFSSLIILRVEREVSTSASFILSIVFLLAVLIFGEICPKVLASSKPLLFSRIASPLIYRIVYVLRPMTHILENIVQGFNRLLGIDKNVEDGIGSEHLKGIVDLSESSGVLEEVSADMIENLIVLHHLRLKDIEVPRVDVKSCQIDETVESVLEKAREWNIYTIPLYNEHHDDIEHYLDCTNLIGVKDVKQSVRSFSHPIHFMSELSQMDFVLREFLEDEIPLALVVDEYGHMSGIVSWNDVVNCLRTQMEEVDYDRLMPGYRIISGRENVRSLQLFEDEDMNDTVTLGGYLSSQFGRVPKEGEELEIQSYKILIYKATEKNIEEVLLIPLEKEEE